ncbi:trans-1,2-dihydrobenzene-1,2-diol dehydrogenase-like isoform X2 [Thrips palmi]|nr:trans-1,2-dihydrobenzene-1,2-diol dehydrogenase-like isoform X2 [Thrips palmi]XP_034241152.1 trans-1,2-dihydrobenzene-1,2-diol dehydrogenase-like isoform X2 [Thrips palmi]XP_034241153.1 trans-1,2-dihydrobenzene-1,2-diol dehydrogenase-like isoform X2 [Thrips palmi]XP_034241154.1 trans-1,2-dihydrobenzene-1,2-diol dehydrogenase-like isoform X2 [Thrips palmi]XP_034241155.1 trans-1,2-dihydrobenzene-1,2-diol dehydrogenase-like isoform X2 [Thrips palmi]XP_034241156.1 trans-1,2-dihydrobenzene-1,2-d
MATNWGIASAGLISHDFATAVATLPANEHRLVAVAARDPARAKDFAARHNIPHVHSSYEELAKNADVEVVYVGTINTYHYEVSKLMLEHGKHVLCEKPLCMNQRDTAALLKLAKEKKLFFMEAIWSRFFPSYEFVRKELSAKAIGDVVQLNVNFGVYLEAARVKQMDLGGGTILDLGVYVLQLAVMVFGPTMPLSLKAVGHLNSEGVDDSAAIVLTYPGSKTAVLTTSSLANMNKDATIYGTKGSIQIKDPFWCPTIVVSGDKSSEFVLPPTAQPCNFTNSAGLRYEAAEVRRCIQEGLYESPKLTHEETMIISKMEDMVRAQIGVKYPSDPQ